MHAIDLNYLFDHSMQQVYPPQTNIGVNFVSFLVGELPHAFRLCFGFNQFAKLLCKSFRVNFAIVIKSFLPACNVVYRPPYISEHLSFKSFRLVFNNFVQKLNTFLLLLLDFPGVVFKLLNVSFEDVLFTDFLLVVLELLFVLLFCQHLVKTQNYLINLLDFVSLRLKFVFTLSYSRQTSFVQVF